MTTPGHARSLPAFLGVGALSALVDAGVFTVAYALGVAPWLASAIGFSSAFVVNYWGNKVLVFRARKVPGALARYVTLVAVNLALTTAVVHLQVEAGVPPLVAKGVSMVLVAALNYLALRHWVFRRPAAAPARRQP